MINDAYQNYIKHLDSIIRVYDKAASDSAGRIEDSEAHGILARAQSAIQKICGLNWPYMERGKMILEGRYAVGYQAEQIVGIVRGAPDDVSRLIEWVRDFIGKNPA